MSLIWLFFDLGCPLWSCHISHCSQFSLLCSSLYRQLTKHTHLRVFVLFPSAWKALPLHLWMAGFLISFQSLLRSPDFKGDFVEHSIKKTVHPFYLSLSITLFCFYFIFHRTYYFLKLYIIVLFVYLLVASLLRL